MVGTLSQSDYRWGPSANQITGVHAGVAHAGVACAGVACAGVACTGVACAGVVGTLSQSDYTGVVCTGVARAGVVGTLSQSDYTGVAHAGWWGHLANQITQGLHAQGLCRGCMHRGDGDT